ncbi:hypothetical protein KQX54_017382 [Cotesia glomerata]|uniref:Uncharacterized protein n=1 Tax=Cotesia glomerata TaxID=32391 RepID=A0AAV7HYC8_COTGL|nr:hypothetical protein KQX54_017382 [Cotesia glomerata]
MPGFKATLVDVMVISTLSYYENRKQRAEGVSSKKIDRVRCDGYWLAEERALDSVVNVETKENKNTGHGDEYQSLVLMGRKEKVTSSANNADNRSYRLNRQKAPVVKLPIRPRIDWGLKIQCSGFGILDSLWSSSPPSSKIGIGRSRPRNRFQEYVPIFKD